MTKLEQSLSELAKVRTMQSLHGYIDDVRHLYSLENVAFHVTKSPTAPENNPILLVTYEEYWIKRYVQNNYFEIDPVVLVGSSSFLPLDWSHIDRSSGRMRSLFAEAASYGVGRQGLTLPIRGPSSERSLITVTSYVSEEQWLRRRIPLMRDFQTLAHYMHDKAITLSGLRVERERPKLSRREYQCLELLTRGQPPKKIAHKLDISISSVRLYLCSAKLKLGAANMNEAIALAVRDEHVQV